MFDPADIHRLPIFRHLSRVKLDEALTVLMPCEVGPGQVLMQEGESDRSMFIVLEGELLVGVGQSRTEVARLGRGEIVGEMALFGVLDRRAATVTTLSNCKILILEQSGMQHLRRKRSQIIDLFEEYALRTMARRLRMTNAQIGHMAAGQPLPGSSGQGLWSRMSSVFGGSRKPTTPPPNALTMLRQAPAFRELDPRAVEGISRRLSPRFCGAGERIIAEGEQGGDGFMVASGEVDVYRAASERTHERVARLREGGVFGVVSMVDGAPRSATCIAAEPTWLFTLPGYMLLVSDDIELYEVRAFRRGIIEALAAHLRLANAHVDYLTQQLRQGLLPDPTPRPTPQPFAGGFTTEPTRSLGVVEPEGPEVGSGPGLRYYDLGKKR
ncbi:MAG: cyclic nucleotide-binding domain-containing protein [Alphaproteobacteria bacterium]|nr:cyclic nucleotide-binding domain-containing protein [Alphaproteobacteria bacterium]